MVQLIQEDDDLILHPAVLTFEGLDLLQHRLVLLVRLDLEESLPRPFQVLLTRLQLGILFLSAFPHIFQLLPLLLHDVAECLELLFQLIDLDRKIPLLRMNPAGRRFHFLQFDQARQLFFQPPHPFPLEKFTGASP